MALRQTVEDQATIAGMPPENHNKIWQQLKPFFAGMTLVLQADSVHLRRERAGNLPIQVFGGSSASGQGQTSPAVLVCLVAMEKFIIAHLF